MPAALALHAVPRPARSRADASAPPAPAGADAAAALARWPSGVVVATVAGGGGAVAHAARAFSSVSLAPPLCAMVLDDAAAFAPGTRFTVNVLSAAQRALPEAFGDAGAVPLARLAGGPGAAAGGAPRLDGCSAWLECTVEAVHACGARALVIGRVARIACGDAPPLLSTDAGPMACVPLPGEAR